VQKNHVYGREITDDFSHTVTILANVTNYEVESNVYGRENIKNNPVGTGFYLQYIAGRVFCI
jgi:hypothetical protein